MPVKFTMETEGLKGTMIGLSFMQNKINDDMKQNVDKAGEFVLTSIINKIKIGDPSWKPLSEEWGKRTRDPRLFVDTGEFLNRQRIRVIEDTANKYKIAIGSHEVDIHLGSGLDMGYLAEILQGDNRPLYSIVEKETRPQVRQMLRKIGAD